MDSAKTRGVPGEPTRLKGFPHCAVIHTARRPSSCGLRFALPLLPDYTNQAIAWLDGTFKDGAVMTKIWKEVGMELRRRDGSFVLPDDPVFDPIYEFLAAHGKPLMAHF